MNPLASTSSSSVTQSDIDDFYRDGFIRRIRVVSAAAMATIRDRIDREVLPSAGPAGPNEKCRHLDHQFLRELACSPPLVEVFSRLCGPDLLVWSTNFWIKPPGGRMTCWHQDVGYWPINPQLNYTAWIAIEPTTLANSCLQLIPGSHRQVFQTRKIDGILGDEAILDDHTLAPPVAIELEAGEAVIFNERILHHAAANESDRRRIGFSVRVIPPFVELDRKVAPLWPEHRCVLMAGQDRFRRNPLLDG